MDIKSVLNLQAPARVSVAGVQMPLCADANGVWRTEPNAEIRLTVSEHNGMQAVYVDAKLESGTFAAERAITLTYAVSGVAESMADYRYSPFWCRPAFASTVGQIPAQTQALLSKLQDGSWFFVLPLCDSVYKCTLAGNENGLAAVLESYTDTLSDCSHQLALVCACGEDPYRLVEQVAAYAAELLNNGTKLRTAKKYPAVFEKLGWCTWDAMHVHVNDAGIQQKIAEFREKGVPVQWVILDDMWATVPELVGIREDHKSFWNVFHNGRLSSFEAAPERFPEGLAGCIEKIHNAGLQVGVWYPMTGYWRGFDPNGDAAKAYGDGLTQINGKLLVKPEKESADKTYSAIAKWFRDCGADFLKIDNQSSYVTNYFNCGVPVGELANTLQSAIESSAIEHFGKDGDISLINCMGMANENMFHRRDSAISRCSDDFKPENREWFAKHILQCSFNSLIQGQYYYNDWDMWWSGDAQGLKNSVCRAISGGPIYISDRNGETRPEILKPLIFDDGTVIRTEVPALPTVDCLTVDPTVSKQPMKIFSRKNASILVAAFNVDSQNGAVNGSIRPADFGLTGEIAVYEYFTKQGSVIAATDSVSVSLADPDVFRLYTLTPMQNGVALIGASDKMIAAGTYAAEGTEYRALCDGCFTIIAQKGAEVTVNGVRKTLTENGVSALCLKLGDRISI